MNKNNYFIIGLLVIFSFSFLMVAGAEEQCDKTGDLNNNDQVNVLDVQCSILSVLAVLKGLPTPDCVQCSADVNCDNKINVVDTTIVIKRALDLDLPWELDADQNNVPDTCEVEEEEETEFCVFEDENLKNVVKDALDLGSDELIKKSDAEGLTEIDAIYKEIKNLNGSECLTNLKLLNLGYNNISDVSPLSGLINLNYLDLHYNNVDVSSLSGLTNLESLNLNGNDIVDISSLSGLINLEELHLHWNDIIWDDEACAIVKAIEDDGGYVSGDDC